MHAASENDLVCSTVHVDRSYVLVTHVSYCCDNFIIVLVSTAVLTQLVYM